MAEAQYSYWDVIKCHKQVENEFDGNQSFSIYFQLNKAKTGNACLSQGRHTLHSVIHLEFQLYLVKPLETDTQYIQLCHLFNLYPSQGLIYNHQVIKKIQEWYENDMRMRLWENQSPNRINIIKDKISLSLNGKIIPVYIGIYFFNVFLGLWEKYYSYSEGWGYGDRYWTRNCFKYYLCKLKWNKTQWNWCLDFKAHA